MWEKSSGMSHCSHHLWKWFCQWSDLPWRPSVETQPACDWSPWIISICSCQSFKLCPCITDGSWECHSALHGHHYSLVLITAHKIKSSSSKHWAIKLVFFPWKAKCIWLQAQSAKEYYMPDSYFWDCYVILCHLRQVTFGFSVFSLKILRGFWLVVCCFCCIVEEREHLQYPLVGDHFLPLLSYRVITSTSFSVWHLHYLFPVSMQVRS